MNNNHLINFIFILLFAQLGPFFFHFSRFVYLLFIESHCIIEYVIASIFLLSGLSCAVLIIYVSYIFLKLSNGMK